MKCMWIITAKTLNIYKAIKKYHYFIILEIDVLVYKDIYIYIYIYIYIKEKKFKSGSFPGGF